MKKAALTIGILILLSAASEAQIQLMGMTSQGGKYDEGVIFKADASGHSEVAFPFYFHPDGAHPNNTSLIQAKDGKIYGMTTFGGKADMGLIFQFDPNS